MDLAEEIYAQISPLIELAGPTHKIVFNGHSIGGSLALLLLFLLTEHRGGKLAPSILSSVCSCLWFKQVPN